MTNSTVPAPVAFEDIRNAIERACQNENYLEAVQAAERHGLQGGPIGSQGLSLTEEYLRTYPDGHVLKLRYHMYDQTKTFGPTLKDMNKLDLELTLNGTKVRSHGGRYED